MRGPQAVRVLVTGGTLDKVHDAAAEALTFPPDGRSQIPALLRQGRCHFVEIGHVLQKDSLDFDDADRDAILKAIRGASETALVVTHGTGTMGRTARWLEGRIGGRTVVLTGAMRPHSLGRSDASFNVGGAIVAAQLLPAGVWGVMNGRAIPAARLEKNVREGRFDV